MADAPLSKEDLIVVSLVRAINNILVVVERVQARAPPPAGALGLLDVDEAASLASARRELVDALKLLAGRSNG